MPVVNYEQYCEMLNRAYEKKYAYPAFNVYNIETIAAVFSGLQRANSDGIIQISTQGAAHASGVNVKDSLLGAVALADYIQVVAEKYAINVAIHTDHCRSDGLENFLLPLIDITEKRKKEGFKNLFNSHSFDGSDLILEKNLEIAKDLLKRCCENEIILEIIIGAISGEHDGVNNNGVENKKFYSTKEDMLKVYETLNDISKNYMVAAAFGNAFGIDKPEDVKLKPKVLLEGKQAIEKKYGVGKSLKFVFYGGSGASSEEIKETLQYGVVKMNVDTDTQYAFTRPIVDHMFKNYDGVLKIEQEVGTKSLYDPRPYLKKGIYNMAEKVIKVCEDLNSINSHINF